MIEVDSGTDSGTDSGIKMGSPSSSQPQVKQFYMQMIDTRDGPRQPLEKKRNQVYIGETESCALHPPGTQLRKRQ